MPAGDVLAHLLAWLLAPFAAVTNPGEKMYALHLLGSVLVALLALRLAGHPAPVREVFPRRVWSHPSARVDLRFYVVNGVLAAAVFLPLFALQHSVMRIVAARLGALVGERELTQAPGVAAVAAVAFAAALANDLAIYLPHWLQHRVPVLWQFHKVHHSAEVLTPLTVYRFHPVDDVLNLVSVVGIVGAFDGLVLWIFPGGAVPLTFLGVNAVLFAFYVAGVHLRHSHVWFAYPRLVSQVLISPAMHQVHHSADPAHHGKNLGLIFSVWDRVFGTLYIPATRLELRYGLGDGEEREFSTVRRLYWIPFAKAARLFREPLLNGRRATRSDTVPRRKKGSTGEDRPHMRVSGWICWKSDEGGPLQGGVRGGLTPGRCDSGSSGSSRKRPNRLKSNESAHEGEGGTPAAVTLFNAPNTMAHVKPTSPTRRTPMKNFIRGEEGQTATEYMLIISVVVIAVVAAAYEFVPLFKEGVIDLGNDVKQLLSNGGQAR